MGYEKGTIQPAGKKQANDLQSVRAYLFSLFSLDCILLHILSFCLFLDIKRCSQLSVFGPRWATNSSLQVKLCYWDRSTKPHCTSFLLGAPDINTPVHKSRASCLWIAGHTALPGPFTALLCHNNYPLRAFRGNKPQRENSRSRQVNLNEYSGGIFWQ